MFPVGNTYIFPVDNLLFPKFSPNEKYLKCMKYFGKKGEMIVVVCFLFALTLKYTKSICRRRVKNLYIYISYIERYCKLFMDSFPQYPRRNVLLWFINWNKDTSTCESKMHVNSMSF